MPAPGPASPRDALRRNRCNFAMLIIGAGLLAIGVVAFFGLERLIKHFIEDGLKIKRDSMTFKLWTHPPADVYFEIYLMNVTNPKEAAAGLEKPNLVNQGPYVFKELRRKLNVTYHGNGTVSFYEPVFYFWDAKRSKGNKLSDKITQLDLIVAGLSHKFSLCTSRNSSLADCAIPFLSHTVLPSLNIFDIAHELFDVQKRSIFKTYTVNDLLFNGYVDPFLTKFRPLAEMSGEKLPKRVGLMWDRNGSANGVYTMETGENGMRRYSEVTNFNGQAELTVWNNKYANRIEGTIGHGFAPFLKQGERIKIFAGDLCRSSELEYNTTNVVDDVLTYVFKPPKDPPHEGFCYPDKSNCPPAGLMDETACFKEPTFMGKPHFYESDPLLGSVFTGLHPNEDEHETIMQVDPYTGAVIDVDKRLMIYFPVRQSFITRAGGIKLAPNTRDGLTTIFPMFWVNETAKIQQVVFDQIIYMVYPAMAFAKYTPIAILGTGVLLIVIATIRAFFQRPKQNTSPNRRLNEPLGLPLLSEKAKEFNAQFGSNKRRIRMLMGTQGHSSDGGRLIALQLSALLDSRNASKSLSNLRTFC